MERELWGRITDLFDAALAQEPADRLPFLKRSCAGDELLFRQVSDLLLQFEESSEFLEKPIFAPTHALSVGELIADRYQIEALVGRGGMGEVYRAHDRLVDETVALKTLRRNLGDDEEFARRFRREVQLARKVTHPSVCRVFDVGVHRAGSAHQVNFFAMQFLDGETLTARIRRAGPLPRDEALARATEMASGLDAAHAAGIVHRDFKSGNVMLCKGGAVIMDFGLARATMADRASPAAGSITVAAQIAGTIAYMSPEQLSGGTVTTASDIYSFGIVLFEMATGRLPFPEQHIIRSAMQRASENALDLGALAPEIDADWAAAITRCLRVDPARRFATASAAVAEISRKTWRPPMVYWNRRQWTKAVVAMAAAAGGVALFPAAFRYYAQDVTLPDGAEVLLGAIANSTGDVRLDGVTELFRNQLAQSVRVNLIGDDRLSTALVQMGASRDSAEPAAVREAAWRLNAALLVFGNLSKIGPDYALNVQLETRGAQPDNPRSKLLRTFSASNPDELMHAVRDASIWARGAIGESAASIASFDRLPENATTPSWEALTLYARGQQFFMRQDFDSAILQFESALRVDPKFTLAALRRGDLLMSQGRQTEGINQWRAAIALLGERAVTRAEELNARGMFAQDSGDIAGSERFFRTWQLEYPRDWRAPFYRVVPLILSGRASQALELLKPLRESMPEYGDIYALMISCHIVLGQTDEARALVPELRRRNRPERADLREGYIRFREGDCVGYLEILRSVQRSTSYPRGAADAMIREGLLLVDCHLPEAAADNIADFLSANRRSETEAQESTLLMLQAWAEMLCGRTVDAIRHVRAVLEREQGPVLAALAGTIFARHGQDALTDQILQLCAEFSDVPLYAHARHRTLGEKARFEDRTTDAIQAFRNAAALEPPIAHRQYLIESLPPGDPERLELCLNAVRVPWQLLRPPPLHCLGSLRIAVATVLSAGGDEPFARQFERSSAALARMM